MKITLDGFYEIKKIKSKEVASKPLRFLRPLITLVKSKVGGGEIVKKSF